MKERKKYLTERRKVVKDTPSNDKLSEMKTTRRNSLKNRSSNSEVKTTRRNSLKNSSAKDKSARKNKKEKATRPARRSGARGTSPNKSNVTMVIFAVFFLVIISGLSYVLFFSSTKKNYIVVKNDVFEYKESSYSNQNATDEQIAENQPPIKDEHDNQRNLFYENSPQNKISENKIHNPVIQQEPETKENVEETKQDSKEIVGIEDQPKEVQIEKEVKKNNAYYEEKMKNLGFVAFSGRWVAEALLEFEKKNEEKWQQGDVLIEHVWYTKEELGEWLLFIERGEQKQGYLAKQQDDNFVFRDLEGFSKKVLAANISYQRKEPSPIEEYFLQLKMANDHNSEGEHYNLALWCEEKNFSEFAKQQYERVIFINPNNDTARTELGFIFHNNEWLSIEEVKTNPEMTLINDLWMSKEQAKSLGYVEVEGKWLTYNELQELKNKSRIDKVEEQRSTKAFTDQIFSGNARNITGNVWEITYDFSDKNYIAMMERDLKRANSSQKFEVKYDVLDIISPADFGLIYIPILFNGDVQVDFRAKIHEGSNQDILVRVFNDEDRLGFGSNGYLFGLESSAISNKGNIVALLDGEKTRILNRRAKPNLKPGTFYNISISIKGDRLNFYVNGELLIAKRNNIYRRGLVGFGTYQSRIQISSIKITGYVDPKWYNKSMKAVEANLRIAADHRDEFYGEKQVSPVLLRKSNIISAVKNKTAISYYSKAVEYMSNKNFVEALKSLTQLESIEPSFPLGHLEKSRIYRYLEDYDKSLASASRAIQLRPDYPESYLSKGITFMFQEEYDKALEFLDKAIELEPNYVDVYSYLAKLYVGQNKMDKLKDTTAKLEKIGTSEAKKLIKSIEMFTNGPRWIKKYEKTTDHYRLLTDVSQKYCDEMSSRLESLYKEYLKIFKLDAVSKNKSRVLIFESMAEFNEYSYFAVGDYMENSAGYYSPWTKELVLFDDFSKEETIDTLYHEGFHQFLDTFTKKVPTWFNEGMATYFGSSKIIKGKLYTGNVLPHYLTKIQYLQKSNYTPLDKLIQLKVSEFREASRESSHYTLSWSLIQFLVHGANGKYRGSIGKYLGALKNEKTSQEAYKEAFGSVNFSNLEKEWISYFNELK